VIGLDTEACLPASGFARLDPDPPISSPPASYSSYGLRLLESEKPPVRGELEP